MVLSPRCPRCAATAPPTPTKRLVRVRPGLPLLISILLASPGAASSGGLDALPAAEQRIDAQLPAVPARDGIPISFSRDTGEVCTLAIENFELRRILTGTGHPVPADDRVYDSRRVIDFRAAQADGLRISAILLVEGDSGGFDVEALSTGDLCGSWTSPSVAVGPGDPGHPVSWLGAFDRNAAGTLAAVYFGSARAREPYLVTSNDHGASWNAPLSLFDDAPGSPNSLHSVDLADVVVEKAGGICLGYVEAESGSGRRLYTARSLDGGGTLADGNLLGFANRPITSFGFADQSIEGRLLLFYSDTDFSFTSGTLYVDASGNGVTEPWCGSWFRGVDFPLPAEPVGQPTIAKSRFSDDHVLIAQTLGGLSLAITSTPTGGLTWQPMAVLPLDTNTVHSAARTDSGTWVVAWETWLNDPDTRYLTDIYALVSTDDGATFVPTGRIDDGPAGTARASLGRMAAGAADDVVVPYLQYTDGGRATDIYMETSATATLGSGPDPRIDADGVAVSVAADPSLATASDDEGRVFVAFTAIDSGPHPDLFVARSGDGGYSFEPPLRIGHGAPGALVHRDPRVAVEGNNVYVAFAWYEAGTGLLHVGWRASNDLGVTWPHEVEIGSFPWENWIWPYSKPNNYEPDLPSIAIATWPAGMLYVAYNDDVNAVFAASSDGGTTIGTLNADADQTSARVRGVDLCALGGDLMLAYAQGGDHFAIFSGDEGGTWDPRVQINPGGTFTSTSPELACGASGAIVTFGTYEEGFGWRAFDSPVWLPAGGLGTAAPFPFYTSAVFLDDSTIVAAFDEFDGVNLTMHTTRSLDGGATFAPPLRVDPPGAGETSGVPVLVTTRTTSTEIHLYWSEDGLGSVFEPVVSYSLDDGMSWSTPQRTGHGSACEGVLLTGIVRGRNATPVGAGTLLGWWAYRDSATGDVVVNVLDRSDPDRDASPLGSDCDPEDPNVYPGAPEIADGQDNQCPGDPGFGIVDEIPPGAVFGAAGELTWDAVPGATTYRVVRSDSPALDAGCWLEITTENSLVDPQAPAPGGVRFYVAQVYEPFAGSFGTDSNGVPRSVPCAAP